MTQRTALRTYSSNGTAAKAPGSTNPGAGARQPALELIAALCKQLHEHKINYCHWKSNAAIDRSESGENDLDLLISRRHAEDFAALLARLGFKQVNVQADKQLPGIVDYYGFDQPSGRLVHLHAHYQLVAGDDTTKNYRLPVEEAYLADAVPGELFRVADPAFEYVIFIIRMMLKHTSLDGMAQGQASLSKTEKGELTYLEALAAPGRVIQILRGHLPLLDPALFADCRRALAPNASLAFRAVTGQALVRAIDSCGRRPQWLDVTIKTMRRVQWGVRRHLLGRPSRKRFATGGMMIAIVGGDGAGKSTLVSELNRWLGGTFPTRVMHLGKPPRSPSSLLMKTVLKVRKLLSPERTAAGKAKPAANVTPAFPGYGWLLWHVLTARDRYRAYVAARRFVGGGGIVVCDRYPLAQVAVMDGERTGWVAATKPQSRLVRSLVGVEQRYYRRILPPDLLIVLRVDPEIAVQRRSDEDPVATRTRNAAILNTDWGNLPAHVIDAGQERERVLAEVKSVIWSSL